MKSQNQNTTRPSTITRPFPRIFCWRTLQRTVLTIVCLATLVAILYTIENWRGKRGWQQCKAALEAKGVVLDWNAYIPPPVPDDQNFFKAPGIDETNWVGRSSRELSGRLAKVQSSIQSGGTNALLIANVTITRSGDAQIANGAALLRLNGPNVRAEAKKLLEGACGPIALGAQGFVFIPHALDRIQPVQIMLASEHMPDTKEISELFSECFVDHAANSYRLTRVQIESTGTNSFRLLLKNRPVAAADYLKLTDSFESDFDIVREALKRPYARMDGDYGVPALIPIPNFITMRNVAQSLSQRAQCQLLLGRPDEALRDLTLLRDICRITEGKPTGKPMTLVAAMINVAITGLYGNTVADGFRLQAWREPQLIAVQEQLARVNLAPLVEESFREERAFATHSYEHVPRSEIVKYFSLDGKVSLLKCLKDSRCVFVMFAPRGWFYQNMIVHSQLIQPIVDTYDARNDVFLPANTRIARQQIENFKISPYNFLAVTFLPNFTRTWMTVAHNQTLANEALLACALERYHLAHGEYPETLDALAPQLITKIPHDVMGGQPLHYHRAADGKFALYSIGWNEKHDGGTVALTKDGKEDLESGDWVWEMTNK